MLRDLLKARGLLWMLVQREFRARYAGSHLGALWNIIHPIVLISIYVLIFSQLMGERLAVGGMGGRFAYAIHLCSALVPFLLFSEVVSRSSSVLVENGSLLKKLALPGEVLFLGVFITSMAVYSVGMVALILFLLALGAELSWTVVFAFPLMLMLGVAAVGMGMVLSVLTVLIRDVGQFVQIGLLVMFWSLPIVYVPSIIDSDRINALLALNPMRGFFTLIQWLFGSVEADFSPDAYWLMVLLPFAAVLLGVYFLRRNRGEILDSL